MKFKAQFATSRLTTFIVNTCLLVLSSSSIYAVAAQDENTERWFEIEVILFEQLGDKTELKEQFLTDTSATRLPKYKQVHDLLTPYLQPDLTAIKQYLPLCSHKDGTSRYSLSQQKLSLALPEQTQFIQQANDFNYQPLEISFSSAAEDSQTATIDVDNKIKREKLTALPKSYGKESDAKESETEESTPHNPLEAQSAPEIDHTLTFDWQTEALNSARYSPAQLCVYTQSDFEEILDEQQLANFSLDGFAIASLTKRLNASGAHIKSSPYLIADEALLLKDINTRISWSKAFKPLLHFGWRQLGITRTKAIPMKLFAGQHVENDYQQALNDYQASALERQRQEQLGFEQLQVPEALKNAHNVKTHDELAEAHYSAQLKQQALAKLFSDIDSFADNRTENEIIAETVEQVSQQKVDDLLVTSKSVNTTTEQPLDVENPPTKPLQPWFLDGFFKIHLDHYLYITADFNLLDKVNSQHNNLNKGSEQGDMKLINFSQDRRVITGEIHYFDHPYIGMVVQIRRFDPTKPKDAAVSQAVR